MDNILKIHHNFDQDFFREREKRIKLYESRNEQGLEVFSGEPIDKVSSISKEELAWIKTILGTSQ